MKHYALIGIRLEHSYSKVWFDRQHFADADYRLCPMPSLEGLKRWVADNHIDGFNVTNPYKQAILPLLDELSPTAAVIGAVNCVAVDGHRLIGHNTDGPAFLQTLVQPVGCEQWAVGSDATQDGDSQLNTKHLTLNTNHSLILGTGGAAQAVAWALRQLGIAYTFVSRTPEKHHDAIGYDDIPKTVGSGQWAVGSDATQDGDNQLNTKHLTLNTNHCPLLIVNATPVGTWPDVDRSPLDLAAAHYPLPTTHFYDLVYNPSPTRLLREAAALGAATTDGNDMLRLQAELSWKIWNLR